MGIGTMLIFRYRYTTAAFLAYRYRGFGFRYYKRDKDPAGQIPLTVQLHHQDTQLQAQTSH